MKCVRNSLSTLRCPEFFLPVQTAFDEDWRCKRILATFEVRFQAGLTFSALHHFPEVSDVHYSPEKQ